MATLTVFKFDTADGAERAWEVWQDLEKRHLVETSDGAIVSWPVGARHPKTKQLYPLGAMDQTFWGTLFGMIFFIPLIGPAVRRVMEVAMGPLQGVFHDYGINDDFINEVREKVREGTSAVFLLATSMSTEKVGAEFQALPKHELMTSNLSTEQEARLREAFGA